MAGIAKSGDLDGIEDIRAGQGSRPREGCHLDFVWPKVSLTEDCQLISSGPLTDAIIVVAGKAVLGARRGQ